MKQRGKKACLYPIADHRRRVQVERRPITRREPFQARETDSQNKAGCTPPRTAHWPAKAGGRRNSDLTVRFTKNILLQL
jgi:hypothetical protein